VLYKIFIKIVQVLEKYWKSWVYSLKSLNCLDVNLAGTLLDGLPQQGWVYIEYTCTLSLNIKFICMHEAKKQLEMCGLQIIFHLFCTNTRYIHCIYILLFCSYKLIKNERKHKKWATSKSLKIIAWNTNATYILWGHRKSYMLSAIVYI